MTAKENSAGSRQVIAFRDCSGNYADKGKWADYRQPKPRTKNNRPISCDHLALGDTYHVQFNFDRLLASDPGHVTLRK
jgi:hypothetical protein